VSNEQLIFVLCVFGLAALLTWWVSQFLMGRKDQRLRDRLRKAEPTVTKASAGAKLGNVLARMGQAAAKPFEPTKRENQSALRQRLAQAGIYSPSGVRAVVGGKVILLGVGLVGGYVLGHMLGNLMLGLSVGGLVGYLLPSIWLKNQTTRHRTCLDRGLSDAMDLLVVCVEAGLTLDSAMQRVGQEISIAHPRLAREFEITHMETRVGVSRAEALRNMGTRTGSKSLQALSAMLIQAERFGTSIAGALRIHGECLRTERQHAAEELAAKATVKLSFPVVLFIFPALLIVLAGPACIGLFRSALFAE